MMLHFINTQVYHMSYNVYYIFSKIIIMNLYINISYVSNKINPGQKSIITQNKSRYLQYVKLVSQMENGNRRKSRTP